MITTNLRRVAILGGLSLPLLLTAPSAFQAAGQPDRGPRRTAVSGNFDWTIIPPNLTPYIIPGTDGDLHLRQAPLAGRFTFSGRGVEFDGKIHVALNGELDATGSGVLWSDATITTTVDGVKAIAFEGRAASDTVNLVSVGTISLSGRGPYEGSKLELAFEELGPGNSDTYRLTGHLSPAPSR